MDENDRIRQLEISEKRKEEEKEHILSLPDIISVPVTLRMLSFNFQKSNWSHQVFYLGSIGTTIWSLGELNVGKGRSKAWSSRGVSI